MKIAVECKSPLLQKSLELFLERYLSSLKQCDIVVRDSECMDDVRCFSIANTQHSDMMKPFSKSQLLIELEKKYNVLYKCTIMEQKVINKETDPIDFNILEKRIQLLTQEYQENIIRAVKAFYEA